MARVADGVAGAAGLIAVVTLAARAAGFARTLVFAEGVRAAGVGEAYNAVNAVPNVLYEVAAGGALAAVAIPLVAGHLARGSDEDAHRVGSALLTWALTILVPLAVVVFLAAGPLARWLVGAQVPSGVVVGTQMLRVFAWQIPLYGVGVVLGGVLQAHRRFLGPALAPLLSSLVVIVTYAVYGYVVHGRTTGVGVGPIALLAWGTTLGVAALSLPLLVPAVRAGWRWRPTWAFPPGESVRVRALAGAGLLALAAQQAALLVTIWLANHRGGGAGTLSVYNWVQAVYLLPYAVLAVPLATAAFPTLAAGAAVDDVGSTAGMLARAVKVLILMSGLGAVVLVAAAPWVGAFFGDLDARRGGGSVSGSAVPAMAVALQAFAPGLVGFAVSALLVRALYVRGHAVAAGAAIGLGWAVSALGPLVQLREASSARHVLVILGAWSSLGMTLAACALALLVRHEWGPAGLAGAPRTVGVVALPIALAVIVARLWLPDATAGGGLLASLLLSVVVGLLVGLTVLAWARLADAPTVRLIRIRRTAP